MDTQEKQPSTIKPHENQSLKTAILPIDFGKSGGCMGGYGSGRRWSSKSTTDDYIELDVRRLQRKSLLEDGNVFSWKWSRRGEVISRIEIHSEADRIVLSYRSRRRDGDWEDLKYAVELERVPCYLGGSRVYFRCPAIKCGRRVAILYGGRYFVCRHCNNLAYECQREEPHYRALRKAQNLSARLGGTGCVGDGIWRPKGMHRKTFERLENRFYRITARMNVLTAARFGLHLPSELGLEPSENQP